MEIKKWAAFSWSRWRPSRLCLLPGLVSQETGFLLLLQLGKSGDFALAGTALSDDVESESGKGNNGNTGGGGDDSNTANLRNRLPSARHALGRFDILQSSGFAPNDIVS